MLIFIICVCVYERQKMDIVDLTEFKHTHTHKKIPLILCFLTYF